MPLPPDNFNRKRSLIENLGRICLKHMISLIVLYIPISNRGQPPCLSCRACRNGKSPVTDFVRFCENKSKGFLHLAWSRLTLRGCAEKQPQFFENCRGVKKTCQRHVFSRGFRSYAEKRPQELRSSYKKGLLYRSPFCMIISWRTEAHDVLS